MVLWLRERIFSRSRHGEVRAVFTPIKLCVVLRVKKNSKFPVLSPKFREFVKNGCNGKNVALDLPTSFLDCAPGRGAAAIRAGP